MRKNQEELETAWKRIRYHSTPATTRRATRRGGQERTKPLADGINSGGGGREGRGGGRGKTRTSLDRLQHRFIAYLISVCNSLIAPFRFFALPPNVDICVYYSNLFDVLT
jgi:hypothetical protein